MAVIEVLSRQNKMGWRGNVVKKDVEDQRVPRWPRHGILGLVGPKKKLLLSTPRTHKFEIRRAKPEPKITTFTLQL